VTCFRLDQIALDISDETPRPAWQYVSDFVRLIGKGDTEEWRLYPGGGSSYSGYELRDLDGDPIALAQYLPVALGPFELIPDRDHRGPIPSVFRELLR
jgi:hypothetical protein